MDEIQKKIRKICTTLKDHGGGYYNLSEEQFTKLFALWPKEIVICAAIKTKDGKVIRGHRHADAIYTARDREGYKIEDLSFADQGFVTSRNRYVTREEGRKIQDAAGIKSASPEGYMTGTLFSEDLY